MNRLILLHLALLSCYDLVKLTTLGEFSLHVLVILLGDGVEEECYYSDTEEDGRDDTRHEADAVDSHVRLCSHIARLIVEGREN